MTVFVWVLIVLAGLALYGLIRHGHLGYGSAVVAGVFGFLLGTTDVGQPALRLIADLINQIPQL
ncbi:hypothetical protein ABZW02_28105 [Streptomyces sp. NPDC005180]|uniref:hypothetical protein n=1 Tax=Streptomyces sp. NPDC005180 TaxID=3156868 RepID=UPI0033A6317A